MIYKELDPFNAEDKFAKAGRAAEEQMAFYLKRFFGDAPDILVLNDIRLEFGGDAAQVDHLIIHSHGLSIVESKSVSGKVQIKDDGQWIRWFGENQSKGMASPITQARMQEKFFRTILGKASNNPALFARLPIDIYVAISSTGIIVWPKTGPVPGVCKADQVPDRIIHGNSESARADSTLTLSPSNRQKIAAFLAAMHRPLAAIPDVTKTIPVNPPAPATATTPPTAKLPSVSNRRPSYSCKHCGSGALEICYGHSYFFYCLKCQKNTSIKPECPKCDEPARLRKQKKEFFLDCAKCGESVLYFVNP